jgi:hypothetical protein
MSEAAQHEAVHLDVAFRDAPHRVQAHPPAPDDDRVQRAVHRDELDQRARAEFVDELIEAELAFPGLVAAGQPACASLDRGLEPASLALQGVSARGGHLGLPEEPAHAAQCFQLGR